MVEFVRVDHPRFRRAQRDIFVRTLAPDCMSFTCKLSTSGNRTKLDACCQYGAQAGLGERDNILEHREQIRALLDDGAKHRDWFTGEPEIDADFPGGACVRTNTHGEGCLFLAHDGRGCAIHRASIEGSWDFRGIKPHVCRLFPLSYDGDAIVLSDDYDDYSCATVAKALVTALDAVEPLVKATPKRVSPQRLALHIP